MLYPRNQGEKSIGEIFSRGDRRSFRRVGTGKGDILTIAFMAGVRWSWDMYGKRGAYDWDSSDHCHRSQIFLFFVCTTHLICLLQGKHCGRPHRQRPTPLAPVKTTGSLVFAKTFALGRTMPFLLRARQQRRPRRMCIDLHVRDNSLCARKSSHDVTHSYRFAVPSTPRNRCQRRRLVRSWTSSCTAAVGQQDRRG